MRSIKYTPLILIISLVFPCSLFAQVNVETATREIDHSLSDEFVTKLKTPPEKEPEIIFEEKEEEKKEPEEKGPEFFIEEIAIIGSKSVAAKDLYPITQKYENKQVTFKDLETLAKEIEKEYLKQGFICACFIPPQEIEAKKVYLQVVEAKMGTLIVHEHKYFNVKRGYYYWNIYEDEVLSYDKISRQLHLLNKNPDREVKTSLFAGTKPQTTDVLLRFNTKMPLHLSTTIDNEGSSSTGVLRKGVGIRHNNFLGLDDSLITGSTFGKEFSGLYAYHMLPLNSTGLSVLYGHSYSKSFPKKEYAIYNIDSRAKNSSVLFYQDLFSRAKYLGDVHFGVEAKDKTTKINSATVNRDRLRTLRLGSNFIRQGRTSNSTLALDLYQGINAFGADRKSALSTRGAENTFTKFNPSLYHKQSLPLDLQMNLQCKAQFASAKLASQDEFSLGGIDSVRGYPSGDYLGDNALQFNAEMLITPFFIPTGGKVPIQVFAFKQNTSLVAFFDYGFGKKRGPSATEKETANLASIGAGIRTRLFEKALLRLEWGFPVGDDTITEKADSRFHLSLDFEI
ncbi:MAG: ShlB/FhaC/HecB family hemolysin secretion/activation protein [Candidatus Omnitrophota bacterium]